MFFTPSSALSILKSEDVDSSGRTANQSDECESAESCESKIESLRNSEYACFCKLEKDWDEAHPKTPLSDQMILQFAQCSPGTPFDSHTAWKVMSKYDCRYLSLTAKGLVAQLETKTLFPVPSLRTLKDQPVFYMKPARYFPKQTPTQAIIDNLAYVLQTMSEDELSCDGGIGLLANMDHWHMKNFSKDYCLEFMKMLQGSVPARVGMFLIVNPPTWFDAIWKIMKPMLSRDFQQKVHIIPEKKLHKYLQKGFEAFLPDETAIGKAPTDKIIHDFIASRIRIEQ